MKTSSLAIAAIMIILMMTGIHREMGICQDSPIVNRLLFHWFHAGWIHLSVNLYTFLSLVFICKIRGWQFALSVLSASTMPSFITGDTPILGLSAANFALTGIIIMNSRRWIWLLLLNMALIAASNMLQSVAVSVHLYCFITGTVIGFLTAKRYE